jgi:hypothetical protein
LQKAPHLNKEIITVAKIETIQDQLHEAGFDLNPVFNLNNHDIGPHQNPTEQTHAMLIGHTKFLWNRFIQKADLDLKDPLDTYTEKTCKQILPTNNNQSIEFGHQGPPYFNLVKFAQSMGFAWIAPNHMAIHPKFGPWFSLRAVYFFNGSGVNESQMNKAAQCVSCQQHCLPFFKILEKKSLSFGPHNVHDWMAMRASCPIGKEYQYAPNQLFYHYLKQKKFLIQDR